MKSAQITIKDLARQLNISVSTVSRALRNATDINADTKKAVLQLAQELNYEPNFIAQSLVKKSTRIIGVIVPVIHSHYFSQALSGMTDAANEHNYSVLFCQSNETSALETSSLRRLVATNVDGLLISVSKESSDPCELEKIRQKGIPIVMYDRILPGFPCSKVVVDEFEGAFRAVEHLIKKGCRRIAHLAGPQDLSVSVNRMNGYLEALKAYKLEVDPQLIVRSSTFEDNALLALKKILSVEPRVDGLFCINDLSGVIALKYLKKKGIRVPEDVRVVGFNDDPVSEVVEPSLTTVMQPGYEVGKLSMGILLDEIQQGWSTQETVRLRTKLIVRNSSK